MSKIVQDEKITTAYHKISTTLIQQRTIVLKKSVPDFVIHLNNFSNYVFTEEIINKMENSEEVSIISWLHIWLYFQNLDKIIQAYDAKEMMFLAQQEFVPNIEEEILAHHNKKTSQ